MLEELFTIPVAIILAGVWLILLGFGVTEEVIDFAFGAAITFIGFINTGAGSGLIRRR